jgi:hypothetical protein
MVGQRPGTQAPRHCPTHQTIAVYPPYGHTNHIASLADLRVVKDADGAVFPHRASRRQVDRSRWMDDLPWRYIFFLQHLQQVSWQRGVLSVNQVQKLGYVFEQSLLGVGIQLIVLV